MGRMAEHLGTVVGWVVAPAFGLATAMRRGRTLHPRGELFRGRASPDPAVPGKDRPLAERLSGDVLVRLSDALSKHGARWPDVLGCAIRFGADQDVLLATIKRPWTMPFAIFTTEVHDFLANDYFAITRFETPFHESAWFRVHPANAARDGRMSNAEERHRALAATVARGDGVLLFSIGDSARGPWRPLLRIVLEEQVPDPPGLAFDPFRAGRGVVPRGFVHAMRRGAYDVAQLTRRAVVARRVREAAT